jgi:Ca-activated chloride channel family protein
MASYRRPLWLYPLFQIPFIFLWIFLIAALLFWLLGIGRPNVAVAIALDLSSSTYGNQGFNAPGSVMRQEVQAVEAYVHKNSSGILRQPNQIQIFGFASGVSPLTSSFQTKSEQINLELNQSLTSSLVPTIGGGTNLDLAIQEGSQALSSIPNSCRELLLVTDGVASVDNDVVERARANKVRINAIVIGEEAPEVRNATNATGGKYLSAEASALKNLFTANFFDNFNNNWRWILWWLSLAWIALMWTLIMPLDRWIFRALFRMPMNFAGRLALSNALFWTVATPLIVWRIYQIFDLVLPFLAPC